MYAQSFSRLQVADDEFAGEFEPGGALSAEVLEQEAAAAEDARAERLLEAYGNLNLRRGAQKALAMNHVLVPGRDLNRHDVSGQLGRERHLARRADGAVFGHENGAAAGHALQNAEQAS